MNLLLSSFLKCVCFPKHRLLVILSSPNICLSWLASNSWLILLKLTSSPIVSSALLFKVIIKRIFKCHSQEHSKKDVPLTENMIKTWMFGIEGNPGTIVSDLITHQPINGNPSLTWNSNTQVTQAEKHQREILSLECKPCNLVIATQQPLTC